MKTIAIAIDEATLGRLDRLRGRARSKNRSEIVRQAVKDYLARLERLEEEEREREILRRHRARLRRQAAALVRGQAKL